MFSQIHDTPPGKCRKLTGDWVCTSIFVPQRDGLSRCIGSGRGLQQEVPWFRPCLRRRNLPEADRRTWQPQQHPHAAHRFNHRAQQSVHTNPWAYKQICKRGYDTPTRTFNPMRVRPKKQQPFRCPQNESSTETHPPRLFTTEHQSCAFPCEKRKRDRKLQEKNTEWHHLTHSNPLRVQVPKQLLHYICQPRA